MTKSGLLNVLPPAVIGERIVNDPVWKERQDMLINWLPNAEPFELPHANHPMHLQNPKGMADALASFFKRHAIVPSK